MIDSPLLSDMDLFKDSRLKTDAQQWNPYDDMGGTCAAIRGDDWVVFGSDTRMLMWKSILARDCEKIHVLGSLRDFTSIQGVPGSNPSDEQGKGALYSYDPIGHWRLAQTFCTGAGGSIIQSFFDITFQQETIDEGKRKPVTVEDAKKLMKDAFRSLAERETSTGDGLKIVWLKAGDKEAHSETCDLRGD
uniref:Uncharacterized protein n=1 Tax=Meloidogyne javanica TaxID=6303 RepID=A0A915M142_MELJA